MESPSADLNFIVLHATSTSASRYRQGPPCCDSGEGQSASLVQCVPSLSVPYSADAEATTHKATAAVSAAFGAPPEAGKGDGGPERHLREAAEGREASLVCLKLNPETAEAPVVHGFRCAAETLSAIWGESPDCREGASSFAAGGPNAGCDIHPSAADAPGRRAKHAANGEDAREKGTEAKAETWTGRVERVVLQELLLTNFISAQQHRLLKEAPVSKWTSLLPTVTGRYCQKRFALDVGGKKGADFVLYRHQNGTAALHLCVLPAPPFLFTLPIRLMLIGVAPSHFLLKEARKRHRQLQPPTPPGQQEASTAPFSKSEAKAPSAQGAPAAEDSVNPLLQEDTAPPAAAAPWAEERKGCKTEQVPIGSGGPRRRGPLLRVLFNSGALGSTTSGKRKRGGLQLHVRMRLGSLQLQRTPEAATAESPKDLSASSVAASPERLEMPLIVCQDGERAGPLGGVPEEALMEAEIFGCITGELLEVNELLETDADVLLKPPEMGGWLFIAKPSKKQVLPFIPFACRRSVAYQGWGIFLEEAEALKARPDLLSCKDEARSARVEGPLTLQGQEQ
ncbi:hypothetical protein cyc_04428 [Cyclospora cayetanensis]|uniref:Uncharacterized protein n=1 Tax=Cyclospora cayetanensis TaxID=88456 RepID=A0A1D3CR24_9EIME|nr:hypothetical protein cyc_04428 [Cyclospora cayetanensis]